MIKVTTVPPEPAKEVYAINGVSLDTIVALRDILYFLNDDTRRRDFPELESLLVTLCSTVQDSDFDEDDFVLVPYDGDIDFKRKRRAA